MLNLWGLHQQNLWLDIKWYVNISNYSETHTLISIFQKLYHVKVVNLYHLERIKKSKYHSNIRPIMIASIAVDCGYEPWSGQAKDYKIGICCFSALCTVLRTKKAKTGWLIYQDIMSVWSNMSTHRLLFQWAGAIKIQLSVLIFVQRQTLSSSFHWM